MPKYTIPSLSAEDGRKTAQWLQHRLNATIDLQLTLKHVHWNVVGPNFIGVHEMIDPQVTAVRAMSDELAERIATLGGEPLGTPGRVVANRSWDDYELNRAGTLEHLGALDQVYTNVVTDHRRAIEALDDIDPVTSNMLEDETAKLELFQWFIRAHLENSGGELPYRPGSSEKEGAAAGAALQPEVNQREQQTAGQQ